MSKFSAVLASTTLLLSVFFLSGCGETKPTLHVYNWYKYISPELVTQFEETHNCRVVIESFESNEAMLTNLEAGANHFDLLIPSSYMVKILVRKNLLAELDHSKIPTLINVDPDYLKDLAFDKEMKWSVPYMMAPTGISWVEGKVLGTIEPTWAILDRPDLKGRITLLDDPRETIGAALKSLGYSLNTTNDREIEEARELVIRWKKNIARFESDLYKDGLESSEFLLSQAYAGDAFQAQRKNEAVQFAVPREGTSIACDDFVLMKTAPNPELAYAFINFFTEAENAAKNMEYLVYIAPNKPAIDLVSEEFKKNEALFLEAELMAKSEMIDDLGDANEKYYRAWDLIQAARY